MWKKLGNIFNLHHAQLPTVCLLSSIARVYYSTRGGDGKSVINCFDFDLENFKIVKCHTELLMPGIRGCFDDSGVMPSCIVNRNGDKWLYYTGWNCSKGDVPYGHGIGLAISSDGITFDRFSQGPILDRNIHDAFLVNSPFVANNEMYYCSGTGWDGNLPLYCINQAISDGGIYWRYVGKVLGDSYEAISRPFLNINDELWYSYKTKLKNYQLGYYKNGLRYENTERILKLSNTGWDSELICYPYFINYKNKEYIFYNGNGYGKTGIGIALWTTKSSQN